MERGDYFCWQCVTDDEGLRDHIRKEGEHRRCALCGKSRKAITPVELAALLDPILREHFVWGPEEKVFDGADDDSGRWEQQGEELIEIVGDVLGGWCDFTELLADLLEENDPDDPRDGSQAFFTDYNKYVSRPVESSQHYERWMSVAEELKQRRRFFSEAARDFFDWLFEDVENLTGPRRYEEDIEGVVRELAMNTRLFRARNCDSLEDIQRIFKSPLIELGPPPPSRARAGRMNAAGIPVFYGAMESDTCISEMRAPLGGRVALGTFALTRTVRLLDFGRMELAYGGRKPLSYFDRDFVDRASKGAFLRRVHRLVRAPVLPGHEDEYFITQAIAEYLAHVRGLRFDGIIFGSAQRADGNNVVLFPTNFSVVEEGESKRKPLLRQAGEVSVHQINRVEYGSEELGHYEDEKGDVHIYSMDAPEDDDY